MKKQSRRTSAPESAKTEKTGDKKKQTGGKQVKKKAARKVPASRKQSDPPSKSEPSFPIVGIGASAGGLEAVQELFDNLPENTGMAFVVVTHQHPGHVSMLPDLLANHTKMPVVEASEGPKVKANHVYVGPPGGYLAILNAKLHRMDTESSSSPRLPIDYFFRSLAEDQQEKAICIILSGTATDGTLGLKAIKGVSGMAMVEKPQAAQYAGMPSSAFTTILGLYPDARCDASGFDVICLRTLFERVSCKIPSSFRRTDAEEFRSVTQLDGARFFILAV